MIDPAKQIGKFDEIGSIVVEKLAGFVVCDKALNMGNLYLVGIKLFI